MGKIIDSTCESAAHIAAHEDFLAWPEPVKLAKLQMPQIQHKTIVVCATCLQST